MAYTVLSQTGSNAATGILADLTKLINRGLDPTVAAIPDHSSGVFRKDGFPLPSPNVPHQNTPSPGSSGGGQTRQAI